MNPELERLLNAIWEERNAATAADRIACRRKLDTLIEDVLSRRPGLTRQKLIEALKPRYNEFRRAQRRPTAMPPTA